MNEGRYQEHGLVGIAAFNKLHRTIANPLGGMRFHGQLRHLRNIIQLGALAVIIKYVLIRRSLQPLGIVVIRMGHFFLRKALFEAHGRIQIGIIVHLADAAAVVTRLGKFGIEALAVVYLGLVIGVVAGAGAVLAAKHGQAGRHAHGRGRIALIVYNRVAAQLIQGRGDDLIVAQRMDGIIALLIGKKHQHMFSFHRLHPFYFLSSFSRNTLTYFIIHNSACFVQSKLQQIVINIDMFLFWRYDKYQFREG